MAPKMKQQQQQKQSQNQKKKNTTSSSSSSASSSSAPKLQLSSENEQRLRRLLLNSNRPLPSPSSATPSGDSTSKAQKAKRLRTIYEKLSCEGFTSDQIESALSNFNEGGTFEDALDWLCLNLPGNELPLKFSSGTSIAGEGLGGSISIISTAREDWVPSSVPSRESHEQIPPTVSVRIKGPSEDDTLDLRQPSQADWIRQYMEQQEEDDWETRASDVTDKYEDEWETRANDSSVRVSMEEIDGEKCPKTDTIERETNRISLNTFLQRKRGGNTYIRIHVYQIGLDI